MFCSGDRGPSSSWVSWRPSSQGGRCAPRCARKTTGSTPTTSRKTLPDVDGDDVGGGIVGMKCDAGDSLNKTKVTEKLMVGSGSTYEGYLNKG